MKNINNKKYWSIAGLFGVLLISWACDREILSDPEVEQEGFVGTNICPSSEFAEVSPLTVAATGTGDFNNGDVVTINAEYNEAINWTLEISQASSGAMRTYSGTGDTMVSVTWDDGKADEGYNFFTDGSVTVTFQIECLDAEVNTVNITANRFDSGDYLLLSDFDGNGETPNWASWGADIDELRTSPASPQGGSYWYLFHDRGDPDWYINGGQPGAPNGTLTDPHLTLGTDDATEVWVNALVLGTDQPNSAIEIGFFHNDGVTGNMGKVKSIPNNWSGWRMVSFQLSEAKNFTGPTITDLSGIGIPIIQMGGNPEKAQFGEIGVDLIVLSKGGPFYEE